MTEGSPRIPQVPGPEKIPFSVWVCEVEVRSAHRGPGVWAGMLWVAGSRPWEELSFWNCRVLAVRWMRAERRVCPVSTHGCLFPLRAAHSQLCSILRLSPTGRSDAADEVAGLGSRCLCGFDSGFVSVSQGGGKGARAPLSLDRWVLGGGGTGEQVWPCRRRGGEWKACPQWGLLSS